LSPKFQPLPELNEAQRKQISEETRGQLLAAYKDDQQGLSNRLEELRQAFSKLNDKYGVEFVDRSDKVIDHFLEKNERPEFDKEGAQFYLDEIRRDQDKVTLTAKMREDYSNYNYLPKTIFSLFKASEDKHQLAL
jgi:hypothetical protein